VLSLVDTLVELHAVDPAEVGLADFRPARGLPRPATAALGQAVGRLPQPRTGGSRRTPRGARPPAAELPRPGVVHGDYRLDNVLIGEDDKIKAILDWEMSTLGDPLTDLGLLVMYSIPLELPDSPISTPLRPPGTRLPRTDRAVTRALGARRVGGRLVHVVSRGSSSP